MIMTAIFVFLLCLYGHGFIWNNVYPYWLENALVLFFILALASRHEPDLLRPPALTLLYGFCWFIIASVALRLVLAVIAHIVESTPPLMALGSTASQLVRLLPCLPALYLLRQTRDRTPAAFYRLGMAGILLVFLLPAATKLAYMYSGVWVTSPIPLAYVLEDGLMTPLGYYAALLLAACVLGKDTKTWFGLQETKAP